MKIQISQRVVDLATFADQQIMSYYKDGGNYTKLEREKRFYYGTLGELSFVFMLYKFGKRAVYAPKWNGRADRGDVLVYLKDGGSVSLDIKTATQPGYRFLMIPVSQFNAHKYPIYVGMRLDGMVAEINGYCEREDFMSNEICKVKTPIPTMCAALNMLAPIEGLLAQIQDGETIIKLPVEHLDQQAADRGMHQAVR